MLVVLESLMLILSKFFCQWEMSILVTSIMRKMSRFLSANFTF